MNYTNNLHRLHSLSLIPGHAFMDGEGWKTACDQAMKELQCSDPLDQRVSDVAGPLFNKWWKSTDIQEKLRHFKEATGNTAAMWSATDNLTDSLHGLVQTMIIQAWTAFEVMVEKLWNAAVKERPRLVAAMSNKERGRFGFRSRERIRMSYQNTFKVKAHTIHRELASRSIDMLALMRCVLVHSAGVIDDWFIKDSASIPEASSFVALGVGAKISFTGGLARSLIDSVTPVGYDLIQCIDNWLLMNP